MELGSNDAFLVLEDADIDHAVEMCIQGRVINNGETCVAAKRFVIVDSVYEEFRDKFVAQCKKLKVGDPTNENTDLGPMAREDLRGNLTHFPCHQAGEIVNSLFHQVCKVIK